MRERLTTDIDVLLIDARADLDDVLTCGNPACITLADKEALAIQPSRGEQG